MRAVSPRVCLFFLLVSFSSSLFAPDEAISPLFEPVKPTEKYKGYTMMEMFLMPFTKCPKPLEDPLSIYSLSCCASKYFQEYKKVSKDHYFEVFSGFVNEQFKNKKDCKLAWENAVKVHNLNVEDNWSSRVDAHVMSFVTVMSLKEHSWANENLWKEKHGEKMMCNSVLAKAVIKKLLSGGCFCIPVFFDDPCEKRPEVLASIEFIGGGTREWWSKKLCYEKALFLEIK
jgi:hypothetical protein